MPGWEREHRFQVILAPRVERVRRGVEEVERVATVGRLVADPGPVHGPEELLADAEAGEGRAGRGERRPVVCVGTDNEVAFRRRCTSPGGIRPPPGQRLTAPLLWCNRNLRPDLPVNRYSGALARGGKVPPTVSTEP